MKAFRASLVGVLVLAVAAWGQEGGKEGGAKEGAKPAQEKGKEGGGGKEAGGTAALTVAEVDTNGDGKITLAELKAALAKLGGGREAGEKRAPARRDGEGGKAGANRDKEGEKSAPKKEGGDGAEPKKPEGKDREN